MFVCFLTHQYVSTVSPIWNGGVSMLKVISWNVHIRCLSLSAKRTSLWPVLRALPGTHLSHQRHRHGAAPNSNSHTLTHSHTPSLPPSLSLQTLQPSGSLSQFTSNKLNYRIKKHFTIFTNEHNTHPSILYCIAVEHKLGPFGYSKMLYRQG